jgi:hypothetical protein
VTPASDLRPDLALDAGSLTKIGVAVIVGLLVVGFLIGLLITAIVVRLVIAVIVVAVAILVWQQRSSVLDKLDKSSCQLHGSFFGISVSAPPDVQRYCRRHARGTS